MPKGSYSAKQRKLAAVAPPRDKITAADLKKLRSKAYGVYEKANESRRHFYPSP